MHQALYRKWRPRTFDEVCGQEHITSILKYETENNKFSHAYLFCGSRGTGKTTCAKILAKAINCESPINGSPCNKCASCQLIDSGNATDVLEMDAASNNGVDDIRDIRDEVVYMPSSLKYRVYIVDEVHMLSGSAFNALLKTLEEPPAHVVFILATTELHKLPSTIVSRCQRFDFRRISTQILTDRLAFIADSENIDYEKDALRIIAKLAQGGMRDAISLLELCAGTRRKITGELVDDTIGSGGRENVEDFIRAIAEKNLDALFLNIDKIVRSSRDISVFWQDLISYYRDMLIYKTTANAEKYLDLTENEALRLKKQAELFTKATLMYHCRVLDETAYSMSYSGTSKRMLAEMALIKLCDNSVDTSLDALLSRISVLENAIALGVPLRKNDIEDVKNDVTSIDRANDKKDDKNVNEPAISSVPKATKETAILKPLRGWNEIAGRAASGDSGILGFLKIAKAYTDESGKVYLKFSNDFALSMVDTDVMRNNIRAAIAVVLQKNINETDLIMGLIDGNEKISDLDEFEL